MKDAMQPPEPRDLPPARLQARKEALMREMVKERVMRSRRRRVATLTLLPAAALLVGATSYALLISGDQVLSAGVGCYDSPDTSANVTVVSTTGTDPVAACADLWSEGAVKAGVTAAPSLIACVNGPGAIHVFPSEGGRACSDLGLHDLPDDYASASRRFIAMRDDFVDRLYKAATSGPHTERDACLARATALRIARTTLKDHGITDWTAEIATGDYRGRTCFNLHDFDDAEKQLLIIPSDPGIDPNPYGPH